MCLGLIDHWNCFFFDRAAAAAKAVAAMTSSSLAAIVPPAVALANILPATLPTLPKITTPDISTPMTPGSAENSSSALDQAMAATLASIEIPQSNSNDKDCKYKTLISGIHANSHKQTSPRQLIQLTMSNCMRELHEYQ